MYRPRAGSFTVAPPQRRLAVPGGSDFGEIRTILNKAAKQAPARVAFAKGTYRLDPGRARAFIELTGARDLFIDGSGSSIVFTGRISFAALTDCADIHITGFAVDYDPLPYTAGTVVAIDPAARTINLKLLPGCPRFDDDEQIARSTGGMVRSPESMAMKDAAPLVVNTAGDFERLDGRTYRLRALGTRDVAAFAVGDIYIKGPRGPAGFAIEHSPDIAVSRCTMHMCTGIGFATTGAHRLRIIETAIRRKKGRPIACQNGGHNHHDARTGPWVEGCLFEHTGDDPIHQQILFAGNEIGDYPCRAMIVRHARNVVIRDNRIGNRRFETFRHEPGAVEIEGCRSVTIEHNTIDDTRPIPNGVVRIENCTNVTREHNTRPLSAD